MRNTLLALLFIMLFTISCHNMLLPIKSNRYDKNKQKQGVWKSYYAPDNLSKVEHYRHGRPKGKWTHFLPDGTRYMQEKYKKKGTLVYQKVYHPNGALQRTGTALETIDSTQVWYRWQGIQCFYDTLGVIIKKSFYYQGDFVRNEELKH